MFEKDYRKTHQITDEFSCLWCVEQDESIASIRVWNRYSDKIPYLCCWEYSDANHPLPYIHDIRNMEISEGILEIIAVAFAKYDERFSKRADELCKKSTKEVKVSAEEVKVNTNDSKGGEQKMNNNNIDLDVMDCMTKALSAGADKDRVSNMLTHYLLSTVNTESITNNVNNTVTEEKVEPKKIGLTEEQKRIRQERNDRRRQRFGKVVD